MANISSEHYTGISWGLMDIDTREPDGVANHCFPGIFLTFMFMKRERMRKVGMELKSR